MHYDYDQERYIMDVPTECPECGEKLELDNDVDKQTLYCPKCDYTFDATDEFKQINEVMDNDE